MRLKVRVDVRLPLKKDQKVRKTGGEWCVAKFKFERLEIFCFCLWVFGHIE